MKRHRKEFVDQALPNIFSNLSAPLAGLVDTAMLGHLPEIDSLAGVALASVIFSYVYWGFGFLRMGTTGLTAKARGADDLGGVADTFYRGMILAFSIAAALLLFRHAIGSFGFYILNGPPEVEASGKAYFDVRILGAPAVLGLYVINGWLIGQGRPRVSLALSILLNAANIVLDTIFIYRLQWGAYGAGLATALAAGLTFVAGLILVKRGWGQGLAFQYKRVFEREEFRKMLVLKTDIMIRTLCLILAMTTFTNMSAGFGKLALAGNAILMKLLTMASYLIDGYAFALEAIAGQCAGAGDAAGVRRTLRIAIRYSAVTSGLIILAYLLFGRTVLGWLTSHADVVEQAYTFLPWVALTLVFSTLSYVYDGLFIGLANGKILRNSMAVASLCFLPLAWWASQTDNLHLLWTAMAFFMAVRTGVLMYKAKAALDAL
jgi:MATE family, multidrug efflux pump